MGAPICGLYIHQLEMDSMRWEIEGERSKGKGRRGKVEGERSKGKGRRGKVISKPDGITEKKTICFYDHLIAFHTGSSFHGKVFSTKAVQSNRDKWKSIKNNSTP